MDSNERSIVTEGEMDVVCQESRATSTLRTHTLGFVGRLPTRIGQFRGHTYYRRETGQDIHIRTRDKQITDLGGQG